MADRTDTMKKLKIKVHYFLALILLGHSLFFLVYWFAVGRLREAVDVYIAELTGLAFPYITLVMVLSALVALWSLFWFLRMRSAVHTGEGGGDAAPWVFFGVWVLFLAGFYGAFALILYENPAQRGVLIHLLNLTRLGGDALLFLLAAVWLRKLILFLRRGLRCAEKPWPWTVGIVLVLASLVGLWLIPAAFPPNWAYRGDLPTKPALIAHRGASMLAPENTLAAAELAASKEAFGFETDLRISLDGEPFLMHDDTFERTTNIAEVYPNRVDERVAHFTLEEIKALNAGLWFIQRDPYDTIGRGFVSQSQLSLIQGQRIPTLTEALDLVERQGMVILFDMRDPPQDHPYYGEFFDIVFSQCRESGLNGDIWFLLDEDQRQVVLDEAPQMTRVVGVSSTDLPSPQVLVGLEYEIVNVDTGILTRDIQAYRERGLGVNVYTVDESWLFSQFWLAGVTSVTTNNIHTFSQLDNPSINLSYSRYLFFWGLLGIILAIWLASSQPQEAVEPPSQDETPDLMDFSPDDEEEMLADEPAAVHAAGEDPGSEDLDQDADAEDQPE